MILFITGRESGSFFFEYKGKLFMLSICSKSRIRKVGYYDEDGKTLKTSFLKHQKIQSFNFSVFNNRYHPVQHRWKAHKGTDYAAPRGTPITTTASGTVEGQDILQETVTM
jgi:murein DD-endopeptidase MepM/ murein hydrolase activator NlpD